MNRTRPTRDVETEQDQFLTDVKIEVTDILRNNLITMQALRSTIVASKILRDGVSYRNRRTFAEIQRIYLKKYAPQRIDRSHFSTAKVVLEDDLAKVLRESFPNAAYIQVDDISGGCGAMFEVSVEASEFKGLSIVKQHKLVTSALQEHIKNMHGIRIQTSVPID